MGQDYISRKISEMKINEALKLYFINVHNKC